MLCCERKLVGNLLWRQKIFQFHSRSTTSLQNLQHIDNRSWKGFTLSQKQAHNYNTLTLTYANGNTNHDPK